MTLAISPTPPPRQRTCPEFHTQRYLNKRELRLRNRSTSLLQQAALTFNPQIRISSDGKYLKRHDERLAKRLIDHFVPVFNLGAGMAQESALSEAYHPAGHRLYPCQNHL